MRFGPYLAGFRLSLARDLTYRADFLFGRLREFITFGALLYFFNVFPSGIGGYAREELLTYVIGAAVLSSFMFVYAMTDVRDEIADGDLANYLLRPIGYFRYWASRMMAMRLLNLGSWILAGAIMMRLVAGLHLITPQPHSYLLLGVSLIGALLLMQLLDFFTGCLAFWTHRAFGPLWMMTIFVPFLSGAYVPIQLLPGWASIAISYTPFPLLINFPIRVYLGVASPAEVARSLILLAVWIVILAVGLFAVWRTGLKQYAAYGR